MSCLWDFAHDQLILASASPTRGRLLTAAKINYHTHPAHIDEKSIKLAAQAENISPIDISISLAELKAQSIAINYPNYIIGCDQLLEYDGTILSKPENLTIAKTQIATLSGQTHKLHTAAVLFHHHQRIWHHHVICEMTMRKLSEEEIDAYITNFGEQALVSSGGYQIEGGGVHLFQNMNGSWYDILGLPLLPLLDILRRHGLQPTEEKKAKR